jgi:hypothetical protein
MPVGMWSDVKQLLTDSGQLLLGIGSRNYTRVFDQYRYTDNM